ncbi:M56 family metallopeptidase [Pedobacter agri]|uniref:M56 family metallopeptidase n=1 Tax=Pedobacter agri TaxID=454586 RepID=UPI00292E2C7E|nr:M56 family metallopeptidase [Pedobacter agri]
MNWLYYLLEANLYLILFYGFYRLFLIKETFYTLNRYYLLVSSVLAFIIPLLQFGFLSEEITVIGQPVYQQISIDKPFLNTNNILLSIYLLGALLFMLKIGWGFKHISELLKKQNKVVENGISIIELNDTKTAFSFFNMLFIDPKLPNRNTIIRHEMAHINQKHSIDILFFELIRCINWFNPITHQLKNDIKLLHEYLADAETTKDGIEKYDYAIFLIQNSYGEQTVQLTNQIFNSSILKRRINMLNQKKSAKWARLRLLLVLPVVGGMLCTSSMAFSKDYGVVKLFPKKITELNIQHQDTAKKSKPVKVIVIKEPVYKVKGVKFVPPPPPIEQAPKSKTAKKPVKGISPPPPPAEPKSAKREVLDIKISPPPSPLVEEHKPARKGNEPIKVSDISIVEPSDKGTSSTPTKTLYIKRVEGLEIKPIEKKKSGEMK